MDIIDLLAFDNYIIVNKDLMVAVGITEAMLLGELASEFRYWRKAGKLDDGWFYSTCENLEDKLPFSRPTIKKATDHLEETGILETKLMGMPAKKYYRINSSQLEKFLQHVCKDFNKQVCKDFYTKNIKEEYKTTSSSGSDSDDVIPMAAPTTPHVEVTIYDSDDNDKTITVKHRVSPKEWNKAVRKWRKDPAERVMMEFKDTGETEHMTFRRIKKYNVRPQTQSPESLGYDRNAGTAFGVSHD